MESHLEALAHDAAGPRGAHGGARRLPAAAGAADRPPRRRRRRADGGDDAALLPDPRARDASSSACSATCRSSTPPTCTRASATTWRPRSATARTSRPRCARWPRRRASCPRTSACSPTSTCARARTSAALLEQADLPANVVRAAFVVTPSEEVDVVTFFRGDGDWHEYTDLRGMHPMMAARMDFWRLSNFELERLPSAPEVHLFRAVARENPRDERLVALAEVRDLSPVRDETGAITGDPAARAHGPPGLRVDALGAVGPPPARAPAVEPAAALRLAGDGLRARGRGRDHRALHAHHRRARHRAGDGARARDGARRRARARAAALQPGRPRRDRRGHRPAHASPLQPLDEGAQRIVSARRRGTLHPAEIVKLLAPDEFVEHDLDDDGDLVPVDRPPATNRASIVVGLIRNRTRAHPEGMLRVILLGDPTRSLGSLAEPECRRIIAALDLAEELGVPVEWFAVSSGAKIAMDSGTENMDWVAAALRRIVHFTQAGGEINVDRQRHQRRRAAVLQRRGDDAHAHARHPRDDAGEHDGADRQAGARLLGRHLGRGQLRHRRLRADHGPERPGAVLGARPGRRLRAAAALLRAHLRGARRALPAPRQEPRPGRPRRALVAARRAGLRPGDGRRDLRRGDQPRAQEGVRHPLGDARGGRRRPRPARALGGDARGRGRGGVGRPSSAAGRWR